MHPNIDTPNQIGSARVSCPEKELQTLGLAVEQSRDGINIVDLDGVIIYANPASEAIYGYRKGQLVGRHVSILNFDPGVSETQILPAVMSSGSWSGELIQKKQDGSQFPVYLSASIVTKNNEPIGMLGIIRDITESKLVEQALRKSEAQYRMLHETLRDAYVQVGMDGRIIEFNDLYCKMLGYSPEELRALTYLELTPERWLAEEEAIVREQIIPRGYSDVYQKEYRRKDGTIFPVELRTILSRDSEGRAVGMWATVRDITQRKQSEERLLQSEEKFRLAFHTTQNVMGISTLQDGCYLEINKAFETTLGYSRDEVIGRTSSEIGIWTQHAQRQELVKKLVDQGCLRDIEAILRTKSGTLKTFIFSADIIPFQGVSCIMSAWLDISERKRAEDALQQLNLTLEDQVAQRTAIAESRTRQLQSLAVELIEAEERERKRISELLHDDFQQTLAAARFRLESALENLPPTHDLRDVKGMLEELIYKSRQLSHELSPAVLHHSGLVGALEWLCRNMREQFGLDVHLTAVGVEQYENMPLKMFAFRAVQEFLFNVVKHAGVKSARVDVAGAQRQLIISVIDPGNGFDPSILVKPEQKGGIGLLSLRERVSYIGGSLSIESSHGGGSHFTLTIPTAGITGTVFSSIPSLSNHRYENSLKETNGVAIRVLFADDHKVLRQGLIQILSGQPNIKVVGEAVNGLEAVQLARQLKPDVIVMDVSMPQMDGIEATRRIKSELPDIRVIGLSMHADEHISQLMRGAGAEAFVAKTASSAELLEAIYGS
jgi:PAS domain S-box-containing protein